MLLADDINEREDPADGDEQAAELERLRNINKKLRSKYKEAQQEIKNLAKENDSNKTELLDIIRMQEKDIKFNEKLVQIMLNENDQYKLKDRSAWDEDTREWTVPLFILNKKQDEVAFPTIGAKARVEQAREERDLFFPGDKPSIMDSSRSRSRSKFNLQRDNFSENGGSSHHVDDLHDPDMQWHKFSGKGSGAGVKNHNKSS